MTGGSDAAPRSPSRRAVLVAGALFPAGVAAQTRAGALRVAAAADLTGAMDEIADAYVRSQGGPLPAIVYGSSGNFSHQIANGAPFDLFFSADEEPAMRLVKLGLTRGDGAFYALGTLALAVPAGSRLKIDGSLADMAPAIREGRLRRFAIANPAHAPYGRAAEAALRRAGAWEAVRPFLVLGDNVAQAAQFALSGATDGGIVARAASRLPALAAKGRFDDIPATLHPALRQRVVVLRAAAPAAESFAAHVLGDASRAILRRYGFEAP